MVTPVIAVYKLGEIPDRVAWVGGRLAFRIDRGDLDGGAKLSMKVEHMPQGFISFDEKTGEFVYIPDPADKAPFSIDFSGKVGGKVATHSITIKPLPDERDYIVSQLTPADPDATVMIQHSIYTNDDDQSEDHVISGMRIVLDPEDDRNGLYKILNKKRDEKLPDGKPNRAGTVRTLTLCADELIIRGELYLPETNVAVHARELKFEDKNKRTACIDTSPRPFLRPKGRSAQPSTNSEAAVPGRDGAAGRKAGDVTVYVERMEVPEEGRETKRFIMGGSNGQDAGEGINGLDGDDASPDGVEGYGEDLNDWRRCKFTVRTTPPECGEDAVRPGKPGEGGSGGRFSANHDLAKYVDNKGGSAGQAAPEVKGGAPGIPRKYFLPDKTGPHITTHGRTWLFGTKQEYRNELDNGHLPEELRSQFNDRGFRLSKWAGVNSWVKGQEWEVVKQIPLRVPLDFQAELDAGQVPAALCQIFASRGWTVPNKVTGQELSPSYVGNERPKSWTLGRMTESVSLRITEQSLKEMRSKGVPDSVLGLLSKKIGNLEFRSEENFAAVVKTLIGEEKATEFLPVILRCAERRPGGMSGYESYKGLKCRNAIFFYPVESLTDESVSIFDKHYDILADTYTLRMEEDRVEVYGGKKEFVLTVSPNYQRDFDEERVPDELLSEPSYIAPKHHQVWAAQPGRRWLILSSPETTFTVETMNEWLSMYRYLPVAPLPHALSLHGDQPETHPCPTSNAWMHPHLLQTVVEYVRDAYLCGQRQEVIKILSSYMRGLELDAPSEAGWGSKFDVARYYSIRLEVANLLHRLNSQLDYFGNPAGWTPLLSLKACLKMYQGELGRALRMLILAQWVEEKKEGIIKAEVAMSRAIQTLNEETQAVAQQIEQAENGLGNLHAQIAGLESQVTGLRDNIALRLEQLKKIAEENIREREKYRKEMAWIDVATKTFAGICSVIPVGQPALGAVGSLPGIVAEIASGDDPLNGAGKIAEVLGDATSSWLDSKAKQVVDGAKKDPDTLKKEEKAQALTHVSKNVGPALSKITEAIKGLRAPKGEVEAEMANLVSHDPMLPELSDDIKVYNSRKEQFVRDLDNTLQRIAESYGRVASNCTTVTSLEQQRTKVLAHLDHDAELFVRDMAQRARQILIKYLYYVVKSYETTLIEPLGSGEDGDASKVDFRLTAIFEKISKLLRNEEDLSVDKLKSFTEQLQELFENNLTEIERSILRRYISGKERWANDPAPEYRLSMDQTPDIIRQLNATGEAIINLKERNLIPPKYERVRILHAEILGDKQNKPQFENAPREGAVRIIIEALGDGTVRSEGKLYAVRHPAQQVSSWTYHFSNNKLEQGKTSPISIALLRYLLDNKDIHTDNIDFSDYQKYDFLAPPPAWTDIRIQFDRSDLASRSKLPELKSLVIRWHYDVIAANDEHRVLDVRTLAPGVALPFIQIKPGDIGGKSDGFGNLYRIYRKGIPLILAAPKDYGNLTFSHWEVYPPGAVSPKTSLEKCELKLDIHYDTQVICCYARRKDKERFPVHVRRTVSLATLSRRPAHEVEHIAQELMASKAESPPRYSSNILTSPTLKEQVTLGYLPRLAPFTPLEGPVSGEGKEWLKIDYCGLVGWIYREATEKDR